MPVRFINMPTAHTTTTTSKRGGSKLERALGSAFQMFSNLYLQDLMDQRSEERAWNRWSKKHDLQKTEELAKEKRAFIRQKLLGQYKSDLQLSSWVQKGLMDGKLEIADPNDKDSFDLGGVRIKPRTPNIEVRELEGQKIVVEDGQFKAKVTPNTKMQWLFDTKVGEHRMVPALEVLQNTDRYKKPGTYKRVYDKPNKTYVYRTDEQIAKTPDRYGETEKVIQERAERAAPKLSIKEKEVQKAAAELLTPEAEEKIVKFLKNKDPYFEHLEPAEQELAIRTELDRRIKIIHHGAKRTVKDGYMIWVKPNGKEIVRRPLQ